MSTPTVLPIRVQAKELKKALRTVLPFATRAEQPSLQNVWCMPWSKSLILWAADSYRMVWHRIGYDDHQLTSDDISLFDEKPPHRSFGVDPRFFKALLQACAIARPGDHVPISRTDDTTFRSWFAGVDIRSEISDIDPPRVWNIVKQRLNMPNLVNEPVGFNPEFLASILKPLGSGSAPIKISGMEPMKPVLVHRHNDFDQGGLLMPVRLG